MKVTDLEEFAKQHCWQPYWPGMPEADEFGPSNDDFRIWWSLNKPSLMDTYYMLHERDEIREMAVGRLARIGVTFPDYIQHPLVTAMRDWLAAVSHPKGGNKK